MVVHECVISWFPRAAGDVSQRVCEPLAVIGDTGGEEVVYRDPSDNFCRFVDYLLLGWNRGSGGLR